MFWHHIYWYGLVFLGIQWVTVPSMGRNLIRSQVGAVGRTGRSGGAPRMRFLTPSTVSATCIVAATVQESLWNHKPSPSHSHPRPLWPPSPGAVQAGAVVEASRAYPSTPFQVVATCRALTLGGPAPLSCTWTLIPMVLVAVAAAGLFSLLIWFKMLYNILVCFARSLHWWFLPAMVSLIDVNRMW